MPALPEIETNASDLSDPVGLRKCWDELFSLSRDDKDCGQLAANAAGTSVTCFRLYIPRTRREIADSSARTEIACSL
jgi:hypothetical protein